MASDDPDERAHERVGTVLNGKWTLERLLGIGGMAAVYLGVHRNGARAAIKVLHPAYARRKDVRERFLREGYAANRVGHSGAVKVLDDDVIDSGPDEGGAFLVMELLEGQSLEDKLERGPPVGEGEMLAIAGAVLDVLAAAHAAGVIHRDLKPENLFLARDAENPTAPPKIKILDFGLARISQSGGKTMAGVAIGTPSYMPPEQAAGRVQDVDARSDLFALGATCFRVLANRTVHPAANAMAICARMAREPAPKLRSVAPNVSEKTAAVVDRALEFHREDRFPDARAMRAAVDEAVAALGTEVISIDSGIVEVSDAPQERPERPLPELRPARRGTSLVLWLALLLAVGVAAKLGYDRFFAAAAGAPATVADLDAQAVPSPSAGATEVPVDTASAAPAAPEEDAGPLDAAPDDAPEDAAADDADTEPADAETDALASDASEDAEPADAAIPTVASSHLDAGPTTKRRHDAGVHRRHNVVRHHRPHRRGRR